MCQDQRVARKSGRPPAGVDGAKVAEYPQVSFRVPPDVRTTINALSELRGKPHWRIMMEALDLYVQSLPEGERETVEQFVRRSRFVR